MHAQKSLIHGAQKLHRRLIFSLLSKWLYLSRFHENYSCTGNFLAAGKHHLKKVIFLAAPFVVFITVPHCLVAQNQPLPSISKLKKKSLTDLMDIEVISVTKTPQKLAEVASAIQVITGEDIRRSPTTLLPDVLRLAPNLQVTRSGSHDWTVTARGFNGYPIANGSLADKLLVNIDGRAVYNPLFGGVYWDVQGVLKDDIERIEVVSGPGGTLWGNNAVNGVINLITKHARETQGFAGSLSYGTFLRDGFAARYGSHIDSTFYFRVYANRFDFNSSTLKDGNSANDEWDRTKAGFRMDYAASSKNSMTLQGDIYSGREDVGRTTLVNGLDILGRWTHKFSESANLSLQTYFDRTYRNIKPQAFIDETNTVDVDLQHAFMIGKRHRILSGAAYRNMDDFIRDSAKGFTPARRTLELFSGFIQDQLTIIPKKLEFTVGTKLVDNDYTKAEFQPSARLAWTATEKHTLWGAVSRAVRTPSRFDVDITSFQMINAPRFRSEKVTSYELGYRTRPIESLSFSLATFYNNYKDQRSLNATGNPLVPYIFANDLKSNTWGIEFSGNYVITSSWRLRGGVTYLHEKFSSTNISTIPDNEKFEAIDPALQALLHSIMDLPGNLELDLLMRYVSKLDGSVSLSIPDVRAYFSLDVRLNWNYKKLSFGLTAQNLTDGRHAEFGSREVPRSIQGKIGFRF